MNERQMQAGLAHKYAGMKDAEFLALIDATGGWPVGFKYVGFEHTDSRAAGFTNSPRNDGWWTVVASADDYYVWKLSPEALQRIVDAGAEFSSRIVRRHVADAAKLEIRNSRGYVAARALPQGAPHD